MSATGETDDTNDNGSTPTASPSQASYSATQATTPSFLTTLESYADPTTHPMFLAIAGLAVAALLILPGSKRKSGPKTSRPDRRSIVITD